MDFSEIKVTDAALAEEWFRSLTDAQRSLLTIGGVRDESGVVRHWRENIKPGDKTVALKRHLKNTALSARLWVDRYDQYKDGSAIKNVLYALGRFDSAMQLAEAEGVDVSEYEEFRKRAHDTFEESMKTFLTIKD